MDNITLGQKIRELRLKNKMTQKELAGAFITRNMLSQIENDSATPSVKTIEYLAERLEKPIGYFLDKNQEASALSVVLTGLVGTDPIEGLQTSLEALAVELKDNPQWRENHLLMAFYWLSTLKLARNFMDRGEYPKAERTLMKLQKIDGGMGDCRLLTNYTVNAMLAEVKGHGNQLDEAGQFWSLSQEALKQMHAASEVDRLYLEMLGGNTSEVIEQIDTYGFDYSDPATEAKYHMTVGMALYKSKGYEKSIVYLQRAIQYYEAKGPELTAAKLYEALGQCYSEMDYYKKAFESLQKAQRIKESITLERPKKHRKSLGK